MASVFRRISDPISIRWQKLGKFQKPTLSIFGKPGR